MNARENTMQKDVSLRIHNRQFTDIPKFLLILFVMCGFFCIPGLIGYAMDPVVVENTTLPLPAPSRYTKDPAVYPMPLPRAGNICAAGCGHMSDITSVILHGDGSIKTYRGTNGADVSSDFPGINELAGRAAAQNAKIAQIAAGGTFQNSIVQQKWIAALLTNGTVLCTNNCPAKATIESWTDIAYITAGSAYKGDHVALALKRDGTVLCTDAGLNTSIQNAGIKGVVKLALADCTHSTVWAAFLTYDGQILTAGAAAPAAPAASEGPFMSIACIGQSNAGCIAIRENGTYYATSGAPQLTTVQNGYMVGASDSNAYVVLRDGTAYGWGLHGMRTTNNVIAVCGALGSNDSAGALGGGALYITSDGQVELWSNNVHTGNVKVELSPIRATYYSGSYDKILHNHLWAERETYAIYYTTDGSDPQTSATRKLYSGTEAAPGITISSASTLRAAAYDTAASKFVGGVLTLDYTFTYPTITPSAAPGYFVDPFRLTAEAGGYPIHYTTANRDAALSDPVLGGSGIAISDTTTIHMAIEFGGYAVSQAAFTYTKTETGLIVDNSNFTITTAPSGTIQASVPVEKVISGNLPVILVVSVDHGQANICRKVEFIAVSQTQQTLTATLTPPVDIPAGATTKAYLLQSFASMRPISKVVIKK